ncbi:MAG: SdrD B-like domain-containing protein [Pirellulaceae bacterium]
MDDDDTYRSTGNKVQGNSIHSNNCEGTSVTLGIELGGAFSAYDPFGLNWDGPTANDPYDTDSGPNNFQNYPVLTLAQAGANTRVAGMLHSLPSTDPVNPIHFTIDFYANTAADPSGYGEGERYLGWATVITDEFGNADFDIVLSGATAPGEAITVTATEQLPVLHELTKQPTGSTSEFSLAVVAAAVPGPISLQDLINSLQGTVLTLNHISESNITPFIDQLAALQPREPADPVITIVVNLQPGTYQLEENVNVPVGFRVVFNGFQGPVIFEGSSPALTLSSGELHIIGGSSVEVHVPGGVTFTNTTDSPTILVEGGSLYLRKAFVEETTGGNHTAIQIVGGAVDMGTADDPGDNTIIVNGDGDFIRTVGPGTVSDVGNAVDVAPGFEVGPDETLVLPRTAVLAREIGFVDPDPDVWSGTVDYGDDPTSESLVIDQEGRSFALNHTYTHEGTYTVTVTVEDNRGGSHSDTFEVAVVQNRPPVIDDQSFVVVENREAVGTVMATDPDIPDDTLTYSISDGQDGGLFTIDPTTGALHFRSAADFETPADDDQDGVYELLVTVTDGYDESDSAQVSVNVLNLASVTGDVFVDVNLNGLYDANEPGIDGVVVELLDDAGNPILDEAGTPITTTTRDGGYYLFDDLAPGTYLVHERQPSGVNDGAEILGSLGGTLPADDTFRLTLQHTDAMDYIFAELGQQLNAGDTASIGFWQNRHGQELIQQGGAALANWLTVNFGNVFGNEFKEGNATGAAVATFYRDQLFRQTAKKVAGPAKVDCQFMATALATYFTRRTLAGDAGSSYGFHVTDTGIGTRVVNVGDNGATFGVANGSSLTIMQLLWATNGATDLPNSLAGSAYIYDGDGDGIIDAYEASLRAMANAVYSAINEGGGL